MGSAAIKTLAMQFWALCASTSWADGDRWLRPGPLPADGRVTSHESFWGDGLSGRRCHRARASCLLRWGGPGWHTGRGAGRGPPGGPGAEAPGVQPGQRVPLPEELRPGDPKNFVLASSVITGLVKVNTTSTSMMVVRPRVKAKPRTLPIAK